MEINKIKRSLLVLFFSFLAIGAQAQLEQAVKKQTVYRCSERRMNSGKEIFIPYRKIALAIYG